MWDQYQGWIHISHITDFDIYDENNLSNKNKWFTVQKRIVKVQNIDRNIRYIRSIAPHANPNKLMLSYFENLLKTEDKISKSFNNYPYSKTYDCENNFAPITLFDINEMKEFK